MEDLLPEEAGFQLACEVLCLVSSHDLDTPFVTLLLVDC